MADMPRLVKPMLASLRHEFPADEEDYGWELKWDGLRAVAYVSGGAVRRSRGTRRRWPEAIGAGRAGPMPSVPRRS